jgi:hypothetical protein
MKKFAFTTAIALALATTAYAADRSGGGRGAGPGGGGGGGGGPGMSTMSPGPGGGGPSRGPSGFSNGSFSNGSFSNGMGPNHGLSGLHNQSPNQSPMTNTYRNNGGNYGQSIQGNHTRNSENFGQADHRRMYNYEGKNFEGREGNRFEGDRDHHGVVSGNFFEHGRHFHFRRFWHGEWVFLNGWDDCTAYAWIHVGPGTWAWAPINICVG